MVEYLRDARNLSNPSEASVRDHGRTFFHPYLGGRDLHRPYRSLDSALVGAIAYRRCGPNSQAAHHFDLMTLGSLPQGD